MNSSDFGAALAGVAFAGAGMAFLLEELGLIALRAQAVAPALLIALGVAAILGAIGRSSRA